jgi:Bacterial Ig-like domain
MRKTVGVALLVTASIATFAPTRAAQERRPPPLPLEVTFSTPVEGEADVRLDAIVRIQFSRDVDVRSLEKRVRVLYSAEESAERGEAQPPAVAVEIRYQAGTRALEIRPTRPLERFRHVAVELLDGIVGSDGSVLRPWTLHFATGGS